MPEDERGLKFWGRDINTLSHDELIKAVRILASQVERQREDHQSTLDMWELCRGLK